MIAATSRPAAATDMVSVACPSNDQIVARWRAVRESVNDLDANALALDLADCLASPNPELRDRIAYEVLTFWLRKEKLETETVDTLRDKLLPWLERGHGEPGTDDSIARAFAALVLSELVRHDAIHEAWTSEKIEATLELALAAFTSERDYRGLDADLGWIHCIAHEGDLLWRLALHPKTSGAHHVKILDALSSQIVRLGLPAYTHNEGDRLARVVSAIVARGKPQEARVSEWIEALGQPGSLETWNAAFRTPDGMAKLHNVKLVLRALRQQLALAGQSELTQRTDEVLAGLP